MRWTDERTNERTDGRTNERTDGRTDGQGDHLFPRMGPGWAPWGGGGTEGKAKGFRRSRAGRETELGGTSGFGGGCAKSTQPFPLAQIFVTSISEATTPDKWVHVARVWIHFPGPTFGSKLLRLPSPSRSPPTRPREREREGEDSGRDEGSQSAPGQGARGRAEGGRRGRRER